MFDRKLLRVYFIAGTQDTSDGNLERVLQEALEAGITLYQFREKGPNALTGEAKEILARKLFAMCKAKGVPFIVNDDIELAKKIDADGIHLGQDDEKIENIIDDFNDKIIGLSVGNFAEYDQSDLTHVDYIGVGPVYETSSKSDAKKPGGIELIRKMRLYDEDIPIVAIGGITSANSEMILAAGADGISTISSITKSDDIKQVVTDYLKYYTDK
ncbi:thiamine phosphate synthase [Macrococcus epidermidis]|uniref:Thiamine-phosphate synthase n=1 Tax=Macrococcus epidermidis TaxID=1902580 RepID=A0A327ZP92_9STAP|nr:MULTISPECIES: thiamine phosphate synthase [Macrococcus]MCG7420893.1 thiamine phosphate synthase [Macrococcus epidermidis]RAK44173.1 thiamine phosphate synthase [Macrococcus epidermidis]TDM39001.1 thiamine phosphate synthase [Macrococcus goetzii]TDM41046.1 thiamine phosphate synthase [Macrococcus goetzii]TDM46700.1 thiamine phosphate synthase [Macrococcus goetzii]